MAEQSEIGIVDGVPVSGTGEVPTLAPVRDRLGATNEAAPASDTAAAALNGRAQRIAQRLTSLIALIPASLGSKADAASLAVTRSTEDKAATGAVTETAPATDTASSGLNGRLQRVAQHLTSLLARFPAALGAGGGLKTELYDAAGVALTYVAPASDMTHALVALSTTAAEIMPANAARLYAAVKNADASIVIYIGDSNAVTSANGWPLAAGQEKEFPNYVGPIWGIAASATPNAAKIEY